MSHPFSVYKDSVFLRLIVRIHLTNFFTNVTLESGDRARAEVWKSEDGNKIFSEIKLKFVTGEKSLTF